MRARTTPPSPGACSSRGPTGCATDATPLTASSTAWRSPSPSAATPCTASCCGAAGGRAHLAAAGVALLRAGAAAGLSVRAGAGGVLRARLGRHRNDAARRQRRRRARAVRRRPAPLPDAGRDRRRRHGPRDPRALAVPVDDRLLPSGPAEPVDGTDLDFRRPRWARCVWTRVPASSAAARPASARVHGVLRPGAASPSGWTSASASSRSSPPTPPSAVRADDVRPRRLQHGDGLVVLDPGASFTGRCGLIAAGL